ncbi:MAG TPA: heavy metal-associated domain-containing protein [Actinopolymorphaceae bacterium]|nr:heavy metal-associated domain-containing protein [Actinopolymorphaceae bacterium]
MPVTTYEVIGMTCDHCVQAVTAEVSRLPGVQTVTVDLTTGRVTVDAAATLTDAEVRDAVDEAGFELADTPSRP